MPRQRCNQANSYSHFWTTFKHCLRPVGPAVSTTCWTRGWCWRASGCTQGRTGVGITTTRALLTFQNSGLKFGVHRASRCWAHQLVHPSSFVEEVTRRRLEEETRLCDAIPSVRMAKYLAMCGAQMPPSVKNPPSQLFCFVRSRARCGHAEHDGGAARRTARRSHPEESGTHALVAANAYRRVGLTTCHQDGPFLGCMGRRDAHDRPTSPRGRKSRRAPTGVRGARRIVGRTEGGSSQPRPLWVCGTAQLGRTEVRSPPSPQPQF